MGTQSERLAENERLLSGLKTDSDMYRKSTSDRLQNLSRTFDTKYKSIGDQVQGIKADSSMYRAGQDAKYSDLSNTFNTQFSSLGERIGDQEKQVSQIDTRLGTTYGGVVGLKESLAAIKAKQDAKAAPKQVSNLPSNYKATEAAAFKKAEAFQKAKGIAQRNPNVSINKEGRAEATNNSGVARAQASAVNRKIDQKSISQVKSENKKSMQDAARKRNESFQKARAQKKSSGRGFGGTQGKNAPSKPKAGSFGISAAGKKKAAANRAAAKKKASAAKKKSSSKSGSKSSSRGARGSSSSRSRGGSKSGGSKSGGSKSSSRGARGGSSSRSRGGASKSSSRRGRTGRGGRRGGRRCDIRCKFDISVLTNLNLIRDDLAEVAYFVKELQEV